MLAPFVEEHWTDQDGNPAGGVTSGTGMCLSWQHGPLGRGETRREHSGCCVETVIAAVISRLEFSQRSMGACQEHEGALAALREAAAILDHRTRSRDQRPCQGTRA
jgi:hypothetical protein